MQDSQNERSLVTHKKTYIHRLLESSLINIYTLTHVDTDTLTRTHAQRYSGPTPLLAAILSQSSVPPKPARWILLKFNFHLNIICSKPSHSYDHSESNPRGLWSDSWCPPHLPGAPLTLTFASLCSNQAASWGKAMFLTQSHCSPCPCLRQVSPLLGPVLRALEVNQHPLLVTPCLLSPLWFTS